MNIQEYILEDYVICPICEEKLKSLSSQHLHYKHGYEDLREFKIQHRIPRPIKNPRTKSRPSLPTTP
ncbi:hypothetical protein J2Z48_003190 [Croceifilum oryzae]|uniref:Uncharacterized protein n=1 Tax=Croceifilum oryzae TaxID=1553429 RepID=A0AAJ1TR43_9BACL|nr:hypothetical protein [Croceifilum oryzae]